MKLNTYKQQMKRRNLPLGDLIIEIGRCFLYAPYKIGTLEAEGKEKLIVNFRQFDCFTFGETVLALAQSFVAGRISTREFRRKLKFIRYRQGVIAGYSSRLHYFTDWLSDNARKKILRDITKRFDSVRQRKKINYMTTHRASYPALKNENEFKKMLIVEKTLSRKTFCVIGKDKVNQQKEKIKTGDIIAFATDQEGLDVSHVGFAIWQGKNLHLLHASSKEGGVVISKKTLVAYLKQNKKFTSIIVARPL
ncbi:MAG: hypothetical protein A2031_05415 [Deltaproteobacteria bacterium RBG_19FT_COMBO_43_11]|nr:MAG: hypothetical protein A2W27_09265 [Deltaproteobacteria bacterium RBG_16_44_11]OGP88012.1 MAG: hypothetical protein A2031_05415 [Deltaproteobacteria bacterium RBG_19FT_COMBO_43_11]